MQELFQAATQTTTLPYTILLLVVILYWVSVFIGILDLGSFDVDVDTDVDVDVDVDTDVEADTDADGGTGSGWLSGALHFFNIGRVPFMVVMTFLILSAWSISILAHYFADNHSLIFAAALFFPNLFISLIIAKLITSPLVPVFAKLDGTVEAVDYVGLTGTLILPVIGAKIGQLEVREDGAVLLISVKLKQDSGVESMKRGEKCLIVGKSEDGKFYWVKPLKDIPFA